MIKKAAIFLVLVGGGFAALHFSTAGDAKTKAPTTSTGAAPTRQAPTGSGLRSGEQGKTSSVTMDVRGKWSFISRKEFDLPNGELRRLPEYQLNALDSHTEPNNKLVLENVTVVFFEIDSKDKNNPTGKRIGEMFAKRARLEFSHGQDGLIRPKEDKLMEFWDVVCTTAPDQKDRQLRLEMPQARVLNTSQQVRLWTPSPTMPVKVVGSGEHGFEIRGLGLDATIPTTRSKKGKVKAVHGRRVIVIQSEPVLTQGNTQMRSKGRLRAEEDIAIGSILVTMRDDVVIESHPTASGGSARSSRRGLVKGRGDTLRATLVRTANKGREAVRWTRVDLVGAPAHLEDEGKVDLTAARVTGFPDLDGEPSRFIVTGSKAHPPKMTFVHKGVRHEFESTGRAHLIRLRRQHGLLMQGYGFPVAAIAPEFDQMILFENDTRIKAPNDGLELTSAGGLTVLRSELEALRDSFIMHGQDDISIVSVPPVTPGGRPAEATSSRPKALAQATLRVRGNRGFTLRQHRSFADSAKGTIIRRLRIGPEHVDGSHRYELDYDPRGSKKSRDRRLHMLGSGVCAIELRDDTIERLTLTSPTEDIDITLNDDNRLWQVASVLAWFDAQGQLDRFVGKGPECQMSFQTREGLVEGEALEIHQLEANAYRLVGKPAELRQPKRGTLRGQSIFVRQLGEKDLQLHAIGDAYLRFVDEQPTRPKGSIVKGNLFADELQVEPFLLPESTVNLYTTRLPPVPGMGFADRYVWATGNVRFDYEVTRKTDGATSRGNCHGTKLVLRADPTGKLFTDGYLLGAPARFDSHDAEKRHTIATADKIRFFVRRSAQYLTLEKPGDRLPVVTVVGDLRNPIVTTARQPETRLACDGPIEIEPRHITYHGPVTVRSFDAQGNPDLAGLSMDAKGLLIGRGVDGTITKIQADRDVKFQWSGATGTCDALTLDLEHDTMIARGGKRPALIQLPTGKFTAQQVNYNYRTKMAASWRGRIQRTQARR